MTKLSTLERSSVGGARPSGTRGLDLMRAERSRDVANAVPAPLLAPLAGRFAARIRGSFSSFVRAMRGEVQFGARLVTLGPVMAPAASANPAAEIFHYLHAGHPYVFVSGCQDERAIQAVCTAALSFKESAADGPVRVFSWSSANGWRELYPETAEPVARENLLEGEEPELPGPLPFDKAHEGVPIDYDDAELIKTLYKRDRTREQVDTLAPIEVLRAIRRFEIGASDDGKPGRSIFILNGMGPHFAESLRANGRLFQQLKEMRGELVSNDSTTHIVFNDSAGMTPEVVRELGTPFEMPLPDRRMLDTTALRTIANYLYDPAKECAPAEVSDETLEAWRAAVGPDVREAFIRNIVAEGLTLADLAGFLPEGKSFREVTEHLVGYTAAQAKDAIGEAVSRAGEREGDRIDFEMLAHRRFEMLKQDFALEHVKLDPDRPVPVGLDAAIEELALVKTAFEHGHLMKPQLFPPKLMLLTGVSGQGKSLLCKHAAQELKLPIYRLELQTLFNKWLGESERNFRRLFEVLEALSPCVVWIDEIEKALGTSDGTGQTHEVTKHVHGQVLTWLQEHSSKLLLMATCNEPQLLSPAVANRASIKLFVGYQDPELLALTWKSNLDALARGHRVKGAEIEELVKMKPSMTGREISQRIDKAKTIALREAVLAGGGAHVEGVAITREHLRAALRTYTTDFEKDPARAKAILRLSSGYESASGKAVYCPPVQGEVEAALRQAEPEGGAGAAADRGVELRGRRRSADEV
jgi:SpoVK/Ycf46/Vps4 family AAA+-type ATPase